MIPFLEKWKDIHPNVNSCDLRVVEMFAYCTLLFQMVNMNEKKKGQGSSGSATTISVFLILHLSLITYANFTNLFDFTKTPAYLHTYFQRFQPVFILCDPKLSLQKLYH